MKGLISALGQIRRLAAPYFRSEDRWFGLALLAGIIVVELAQVFAQVQLNTWSRVSNNALQMKDMPLWLRQLGVFIALSCLLVAVGVLQLYMNQWLTIRWRRWMTNRYLRDWLRSSNHYRMQLKGQTDNPDQRIADDVQMFIASGLTLAIGLFGALLTLFSFIFILWGISSRTPLPIMGVDYSFPGYLVLAALLTAGMGTIITHIFGRELIPLNFNQQRFEADFRFALVRVRENSEQIALLRGEDVERKSLMDRFSFVAANWHRIMLRSMKLSIANGAFGQLMFIVPSLLIAPSMFSGQAMFGDFFQTSLAFGTVQGSFAFFILQYRNIAIWKAVVDRLVTFEKATVDAHAEAAREGTPRIHSAIGRDLEVEDLAVQLPDRRPLVSAARFGIRPGDRVLVTGMTGAGKSTMFRTLGGIWPFGTGTIRVPERARVMIVPQKPYLPIGTLAAAISYPMPASTWSREEIADVLAAVGLSGLAGRLDDEAHWMHVLSLGEQQRVSIARALLHKPDFLFLDESTASLDEPSEALLYQLIGERLPGVTIVSIGHRSSLKAFHARCFTVKRDGEESALTEVSMDGGIPSGAVA